MRFPAFAFAVPRLALLRGWGEIVELRKALVGREAPERTPNHALLAVVADDDHELVARPVLLDDRADGREQHLERLAAGGNEHGHGGLGAPLEPPQRGARDPPAVDDRERTVDVHDQDRDDEAGRHQRPTGVERGGDPGEVGDHRDGEDDARHLHETVRPRAERSQVPGAPRLDGVRSRERSLTRPFMEGDRRSAH